MGTKVYCAESYGGCAGWTVSSSGVVNGWLADMPGQRDIGVEAKQNPSKSNIPRALCFSAANCTLHTGFSCGTGVCNAEG